MSYGEAILPNDGLSNMNSCIITSIFYQMKTQSSNTMNLIARKYLYHIKRIKKHKNLAREIKHEYCFLKFSLYSLLNQSLVKEKKPSNY